VSEFSVRSIRREELFKLLELYKHLHADDPPLRMDHHLEKLWDEILTNSLLHYLVGELDGELVSSCTLAIVPNLTRGARPYGLVENVVTHRDFRKKGFATMVLKRALQISWDNDCYYKVMLLTGSKKEETLRFYEGAGFNRNIKTGFVAYPESQ
jgi:GNAT superfamily N-acetyltransferase